MTTRNPQEYAAAEKKLLDDLQALIERGQKLFYLDPHPGNMNEEREALGTLVSKFCKWSADDILSVTIAALEDSNATEDAEKIQAMLDG